MKGENKMKIAKNFNEFVNKVEAAERTVLNSEIGQEMTNKLLQMKLAENPNLTPEEWKQTKSEFMTFIFCEFVKNTPEAMNELASHVYNEINNYNQAKA